MMSIQNSGTEVPGEVQPKSTKDGAQMVTFQLLRFFPAVKQDNPI